MIGLRPGLAAWLTGYFLGEIPSSLPFKDNDQITRCMSGGEMCVYEKLGTCIYEARCYGVACVRVHRRNIFWRKKTDNFFARAQFQYIDHHGLIQQFIAINTYRTAQSMATCYLVAENHSLSRIQKFVCCISTTSKLSDLS